MTDRAGPALDRVYGAIADPTRRAMLAALSRGDLTVGTLAGQFPLSLNGVSKHVKVLERAGLVTRHVDGREHWIRLEPRPLRAASEWLERYRVFWEGRLDALEAMLVADQPSSARRRSSGRRSHRSRHNRDV